MWFKPLNALGSWHIHGTYSAVEGVNASPHSPCARPVAAYAPHSRTPTAHTSSVQPAANASSNMMPKPP